MKKYILYFLVGLLTSPFAWGQVERSKLPESGPAPEINIGDAEIFSLDNGLKVILVTNDKLPRVSFSLVLDRDPILEGDKAGLTGFVGEMLMAGTTNRTKDELDEEIDFIGASLFAGSTNIYGSSLKKHQGKLLELMTDVLYNPSFPESELDRIRKQTLTGLAASKDDPNAISSRLTTAMVYGKDHPYGEEETEETVKNIEVADVQRYYQTFFKPNISYLTIVGDMELKEAKDVVEEYFTQWQKGNVPKFTYETPQKTPTTLVGLVDRSSSVQTVLNVTQPVELKIGDQDYITSRLLNQVLGGGSSSRLFTNLREDKGYTYGAYSSISADRLIGRFSANASVRTEVTDSAVVEFLHEINKIVTEGVTEEELQKAKANLSGSFGRSLEQPSTIANFALNIERYNLPKDYYKNYLKELNSTSVAKVNSAADRLIDPDHLYITAVGNGSEIEEKLAQFGEVRKFDNMGFPAMELTADASVTAESVIARYLDAIGGKASAQAIQTASMELEAEVMGNSLALQMNFDAAGRFGQKTLFGGNLMQRTSLGLDQGSVSAQGQTIPLEGPALEEAKLSAYLILEAWIEELGLSVEMDGLKDVEGTPAYKIIINSPSGASLVNYYAEDTGLKIKNENQTTGDTFFSNYEEKSGVMLPMLWTIKSPMIPVPMEAKVTKLEINPELSDDDF